MLQNVCTSISQMESTKPYNKQNRSMALLFRCFGQFAWWRWWKSSYRCFSIIITMLDWGEHDQHYIFVFKLQQKGRKIGHVMCSWWKRFNKKNLRNITRLPKWFLPQFVSVRSQSGECLFFLKKMLGALNFIPSNTNRNERKTYKIENKKKNVKETALQKMNEKNRN